MTRLAGLWVFFLLSTTAALAEAPEPPPLDLGIKEETEVTLTLVNVVVVDGQGRTVPGLTAGDFTIKVDGQEVTPVSLDAHCPAGALDEAKARTTYPAGSVARRLILALDYQHLAPMQRVEVLERIRDTLRRRMSAADQVMIVALIGGLRVTQPFSSDRDAVLRVLDGMARDPDLFAGNFSHADESGLVDALSGLFDTVGAIAGPKALVLFSAMRDLPLHWQFRRLASFAASAEVTMYPVDVRGLFASSMSGAGTTDRVTPPRFPDPEADAKALRESRPKDLHGVEVVPDDGCG